MNCAQCPICADFFVNLQDISAANCGHTFHFHCLAKWMKQSMTCPQCRKKLSGKQIISKLYFEVGVRKESDLGDVLNRIHELNTKICEKENMCSILINERKTLKDQVEILALEKASLKNMISEKDYTMGFLQQEVHSVELKLVKFASLETEMKATKEKLESLQTMETVMKGTSEEITELLKQYGEKSPSVKTQNLARVCAYLNKEKAKYAKENRFLTNENLTHKHQLVKLKSALDAKDHYIKEVEIMLEKIAQEKTNLENKLQAAVGGFQFSNGNSVTSSNRTLIQESLAPEILSEESKPPRSTETSSVMYPSPRILTPKVMQRAPLKRPPLHVQQAKCTGAIPKRKTTVEPKKLRPAVCPVEGVGYNGFGGCSKVDEYPQPRVRQQKKTIKH